MTIFLFTRNRKESIIRRLFGHSKHQTQYVARREPGNVEMLLHEGQECHIFVVCIEVWNIFIRWVKKNKT